MSKKTSIIRMQTRSLKNIDSAISSVRRLLADMPEYEHALRMLVEAREHYEFVSDMYHRWILGSAPAEPASHRNVSENQTRPDAAGGGEAGHTPGQAVAGAEGERRTPGPSGRPGFCSGGEAEHQDRELFDQTGQTGGKE
jgi:hypothetical protein